MDFGVGFQSHIQNGWKHALLAEQMGFSACLVCGLAVDHLGRVCLHDPGRRAYNNDSTRNRRHHCRDADSTRHCAFYCHHQSACARSGDSRFGHRSHGLADHGHATGFARRVPACGRGLPGPAPGRKLLPITSADGRAGFGSWMSSTAILTYARAHPHLSGGLASQGPGPGR